MKIGTGTAMVLNCICALIWNINVFVDLAYGFPDLLRIMCAIVWDLCAVMWIFRYIKSKKDSDEEISVQKE